VRGVIRDAGAAEKAAIYDQLDLKVTFKPGQHKLRAEVTISPERFVEQTEQYGDTGRVRGGLEHEEWCDFPGSGKSCGYAADACQPATGGWPGGADPASAIRAYFYQGRGLFLTTRYLRRNGPELQMRCSCAQWRRPVQHLERFPVGFAGTSSGARPGRTTPSARPISQPHAVACFRASAQGPGAAPQDPSPLTSASCRPGRSHSVSPAEAEMRSTPALRQDITALPVDKNLMICTLGRAANARTCMICG
jgi:hypothetical protein